MKNLYSIFFSLCLFSSGSVVLTASENAKSDRISAKYTEGRGVGVKEGYSTLQTFFSSQDSWGSGFYPFVDLRWHYFNNNKNAVNAGIGSRYLTSSLCTIFGFNAYYDFRETKPKSFHQMGLGFEVLRKNWDFRINGYIPIGKQKSHTFGKKTFVTCETLFNGFMNNQILAEEETITTTNKKIKYAFSGADAEFGGSLIRGSFYNVYLAAGPYYYTGSYKKNIVGGSARLFIQLTDYLSLQAQTTYDRVFHERLQGMVALTFPFGAKKIKKEETHSGCYSEFLVQKLSQDVQRHEIIPVKNHHTSSSVKMNADVMNAINGQAFHAIFVNNTNPNPGDGTFENPFNTLLAAQLASQPFDLIYVFEGDGTFNNMDQGIVLQDNQILLGSGLPVELKTNACASLFLPQLTPGMPIISNVSGVGVTLANNDQVTNIHIDSTASWAILGSGITNATITNNIVTNPLSNGGIGFFDAVGTVNIAQNTVENSPVANIAAIDIENSGTTSLNAIVNQNTIRSFDGGIFVYALNSSNITSSVTNNNISHSFTQTPTDGIEYVAAIDVDTFNTATASTTISGNQIQNYSMYGILVFAGGTNTGASQMHSVVNQNAVMNTGLEGITVGTGNGGFQATIITNNSVNGTSLGVPSIVPGRAPFLATRAGILVETSMTAEPFDVLCAQLTNNNSINNAIGIGYSIINLDPPSTILRLEPLVGNAGQPTVPLGLITPVPTGSCH